MSAMALAVLRVRIELCSHTTFRRARIILKDGRATIYFVSKMAGFETVARLRGMGEIDETEVKTLCRQVLSTPLPDDVDWDYRRKIVGLFPTKERKVQNTGIIGHTAIFTCL